MLTIYRRHGPRCSHKGRRWRRCRCPIWVEGTLAGEPIRKSMSMRDWEMAQSKVRVWEEEQKASALCSVTLERAKELFLLDAQARKLSHETIRSVRLSRADPLDSLTLSHSKSGERRGSSARSRR